MAQSEASGLMLAMIAWRSGEPRAGWPDHTFDIDRVQCNNIAIVSPCGTSS